MSKEKKITVKHFENLKVKSAPFNKENVHPLYFQIIYDRQNYKYKCTLDDDSIKLKFINKKDTNNKVKVKSWKELKKDLIAHNEVVINLIINLIKKEKGEFDLAVFEEYYPIYSQNIFTFIDELFFKQLIEFFNDKGLLELKYILESKPVYVEDFLSIFEILNPILFNEFKESNKGYYISLESILSSRYMFKKFDCFLNDEDRAFIPEEAIFYWSKEYISNNKYLSIIEWDGSRELISSQAKIDFYSASSIYEISKDGESMEVVGFTDDLPIFEKNYKNLIKYIDKKISQLKAL